MKKDYLCVIVFNKAVKTTIFTKQPTQKIFLLNLFNKLIIIPFSTNMSINNFISQSLKGAICVAVAIGTLLPTTVSANHENNRTKNKKRTSSAKVAVKGAKAPKSAKIKTTDSKPASPDEASNVVITPDEATAAAYKANKYRFEKSSLENVQELFGVDISQKDTLRISGFWLSQMRYSIPETLWKTFPADTYPGDKGQLTLKDMDATQRFPLGTRYEGFILTQHQSPEQFYMLWYDKTTDKFVGSTQTVGAEYIRNNMKYKTVSYLTENALKQPVLTVCTRSTRTDDDACTDNCFAHYRIEVRTFKNGDWVSQYTMEQTNDGDRASYDIDCTDVATKKQLQSSVQSIFARYVPKFMEAGEFRNTTAATPSTMGEFRP